MLRSVCGSEETALIIVQLSDIHGSSSVLAQLEGLTEGSDLLVISGDVTTFADSNYFDSFMGAVRRLNMKALYVPGNNDVSSFVLPSGVDSLDSRRVEIGHVVFGGLGGSPPTPFDTPNELPEAELNKRLDALGTVDVLVSHTPPFGTPADTLKGGSHAGSRAVREYVLSRRPRLLLCGHIHEAISKFVLGDTLVINPGAAVNRRYARIKMNGEIQASLLIF
jgi:Icc-related predicted phosphoesterase